MSFCFFVNWIVDYGITARHAQHDFQHGLGRFPPLLDANLLRKERWGVAVPVKRGEVSST